MKVSTYPLSTQHSRLRISNMSPYVYEYNFTDISLSYKAAVHLNPGLTLALLVRSRLCGGVERVEAGAKVVAGQVGHVDRLGGRPLHAGEFLAGWGTLQEAEAASACLWAAFSLR